MRKVPLITDDIYYVGHNDRRLELFENLWPIPNGVAYNSYVILDEKTALIDTVDSSQIDEYLGKVKQVLGDRKLDYLVVNHMEPDHCSGIETIVRAYPDVQLVGNKKTFEFLKAYFGIAENLYEVKEGDMLDLGSRNLVFYFAPMVHWPEVMVAYDTKNELLFAADAFGCFGTLDGGITDVEMNLEYYWDEFLRYYSNIVGKFGNPVQKVLAKLGCLPVKTICATHGPVWTKAENIEKIIGLYDKWSKYETDEGVVIAYASMYGNTQVMAETIARELAEQGVKNIRVFDVSKTHASYIIKEIFKYKGLILGSPTYNAGMHPNMLSLVHKLSDMGIKDRLYASFGSYTWAGQAAKRLAEFGDQMKFESVFCKLEERGGLGEEKFQECVSLAQAMAVGLKEQRAEVEKAVK